MTKLFDGFGALAEQLIKDSLKTIVMAEVGLGKAAKIVQEDAKSRLGEYQDGIGPFPAWKPLADSTLAQHDRLGVGESPLLVSGELYASIECEHNALEAVVGSKMEIAKYQEFGTDTIPPRPFIGPAAFQNKEKIVKVIGEFAMSGMVGGIATAPALGYDG